MKKLVVWDLFGGGQNSVFNGLNSSTLSDIFDVYTFDVTSPSREKHFFMDLSEPKCIKEIGKYPKPDIIVSSPLCQSFSCVLNMKGGGTCFWKHSLDKTRLERRTVEEFERLKSGFTKNLKADTQLFIAELGQKCIDNTIEIIKKYKPKAWYIENPKHSLMWKYIKYNRDDFYDKKFFNNECSYGKYGYFTTKATFFLSNIEMSLKKGRIDPPYTIETDSEGVKWYVLKDDPSSRLRKNLDSRILGLSSIKKMIKARNVKSGMGAMDFIQRGNTVTQKNKKTNFQISESGPSSAIPYDLIVEIFGFFLKYIKDK